MNLVRENESVQLFEQMFKRLVYTNLTVEEATFLPEEMVTEEHKSILFSIWTNYLNTHPNIAYLLDSLYFDIFMFAIFFILASLVWGSIFGAIAVIDAEALSVGTMYIEAVVLGLIGSFLADIPFSGDFPIIQKFIQSFCASTGLSQSQIENIVSSLTCLIFVGVFCYLWTGCPIAKLTNVVRMIGGGAIVVGPPLIVGLIAGMYRPQGNESLLMNYY